MKPTDRCSRVGYTDCCPDVRSARERRPVSPASSSFGSNGY